MTTFGRTTLGTTGSGVRVSADGEPEAKPGGITLDWSTVTAVTSDTTYNDGIVVPSGQKALRYGQILCKITASGASQGMFGPYASGASDGRQTLTRGSCYILDETVLERNALGFASPPSDHPAVIEGGLLWRDRLLIGGAGQPSVANFETVFPRARYAQ